MSKLSDIRGAIGDQLNAKLHGIYIYNFMADSLTTPAVIVFRPELVNFLEDFVSTSKRYVIPLKLVVQRADSEAADDALDELLDEVVDALYVNPSLNGSVDSLRVTMADQFGTVNVGEVTYLACDLHLEVLV